MDLQIVINNEKSLKDFIEHNAYASLLSNHEIVDIDIFNNQIIVNYRRKVTTPHATNSPEIEQPNAKDRILSRALPKHPQLGLGVNG